MILLGVSVTVRVRPCYGPLFLSRARSARRRRHAEGGARFARAGKGDHNMGTLLGSEFT